VSIQLYTPATVPSMKDVPVATEQNIRRAPELACRNSGAKINLLILLGIQYLCRPAHGLVTILTMLSGCGKGLKWTFLPCKVAASTVLHRFAWGMSFSSLSRQTNTVPDDDLKPSALSVLVPCADSSPVQ